MQTTEDFATRVLDNGRFSLDITAILAIVEVVMTLIQNCPQSRTDAIAMAKDPNVFQRARLRMTVRRCCSATPALRRRVDELSQAMLGIAKDASDDELSAIFDECQTA